MGRSWSTETAFESSPAIRAPSSGSEQRQRPEEDPEGAERHRRALLRSARRGGRAAGEDGAAAGGVDVGADQEPAPGARVRAGGDDVLGGAAEEEPAERGRRGS